LAKRKNNSQPTSTNGATVGYEAQLWQMADALLPKLISGELRVKDAERFLKERGI
jgi:hypothetical protein